MIIAANGWVTVIHATHDVGPRGRSDFDKSSPGVIGIGGHTGGIEENAYRIAIEAILYENIVVGRNQEVVAGSNAADSEFDVIVKKLLQVRYVNEVEGFAAENLLNSEDVMDVVRRQAAAETIRHRDQKRGAPEPAHFFEIEIQVKPDIVSRRKALFVSATRVT